MRTIMLSQVIEGISFDIKQMYSNGIAATDIANYLKRKSNELVMYNVR